MYKSLNLFFKRWVISTVVILIIIFFPVLTWGSAYYLEFSLAFSLSSVNAFVGYYLVIKSITMNNSRFYTKVYGGMLVRLIFIIGVTLFLNHRELVSITPFFISFMGFYIVHQWIEISTWLNVLPNCKMQTG